MEYLFIIRYQKFKKSLENLSKIKNLKWPEDEQTYGFIWNGVISKFCITFDLSYKLIKDILIEYHGVENFIKGSPREILKQGHYTNIINTDIWLEMLKDRNIIIHEYSDLEIVDKWCEKIQNIYIPLFEELEKYTENITKKLN